MKDHVLTDGRGVPLSVLVTAANVNDDKRLAEVIDNFVVVRPVPTSVAPQHLALDAAFDNAPARGVVFENRYIGHIAPKAGRDPEAPLHPGGKQFPVWPKVQCWQRLVSRVFAMFLRSVVMFSMSCSGFHRELLPGGKARRWVVEQTHALHDRFRRLVVNWEKTLTSRYGFLCLASALIAYRR